MHHVNRIILALIIASTSGALFAANLPSDDFTGKWYSQIIEDKKVYGTTIFTQLEILPGDKLFFRIYGFVDEIQIGRVARVFMEIAGTYSINEHRLIIDLPEVSAKTEVKRLDEFSLQLTDKTSSVNAISKYVSADKAPWSKSILP